MVQPIDQGSILRSGMALMPDYAEQEARNQMMRLQQQQADLQNIMFQREQQQAASFDADVQAYMQNPTTEGLVNLMAKYPKQSEGLQRAHKAKSEAAQAADLKAMADVYGFARAGRYEDAASMLERQAAAEQAAGMPVDPTDAQLIADLRSGDVTRQNQAVGMISMGLAATVGPDKFASTYGDLNPQGKLSPMAQQLVDAGYTPGTPQFQEAMKRFISADQMKVIPVERGGTVVSYDPVTGKSERIVSAGNPPTGGSGAQPEGGGQPPAAAIQYARQNPQTKAQFDAKYGAGAFDRYVTGGQTQPASGGFR